MRLRAHTFPVRGGNGIDGEMKVYRREVLDDKGVTCDRLKAYHLVKGVTAKVRSLKPSKHEEFCVTLHFFPCMRALFSFTLIIFSAHFPKGNVPVFL